MLGRLPLFLILILCETVLTIGRVASEAHTDLFTVLATMAIFIALVCLLTSYFGGGEDLASERLGTTTDSIRSVRLGINARTGAPWTGSHSRRKSERLIAPPLSEGPGIPSLLLFGGITLYFASRA